MDGRGISDELREYVCELPWERIAREFDEWRFERMRDLGERDFDDLGLCAERIRRLASKEASDGTD